MDMRILLAVSIPYKIQFSRIQTVISYEKHKLIIQNQQSTTDVNKCKQTTDKNDFV